MESSEIWNSPETSFEIYELKKLIKYIKLKKMKPKYLLQSSTIVKSFGKALLLLIVFFITHSISVAQFFDRLSNPQVTVSMTHPPGFGIKVNKIAFGPSSGSCSDQIVESLVSDFVSSNIEVVDRSNLNTILSEHSFTLSGAVDKTSAATLGKILGPSILIFVNVQRCATQQDKLYDKETKYDAQRKVNYQVYAYFSRTRAFLKVSIRTVDLATGRIFAAQTFEYSPEKSNKSYEGYPEFPAAFDVQDIAFKYAVWDIHKMYLPWYENKSLYFFDDKDFNLKDAFKALKDGKVDRAFELSQQNLNACKNDGKVKDKILGHANYNLGMCHMLRTEYDLALQYFNEADKLKSGNIIKEAIVECEKAKSLQASMQRVEDKASFELTKSQAEEHKNVQTEAANTLTNSSIIDMVQLKLPEAIIIQKIKSSKCKFETSPDALVKLTKSGVNEKVMMIMIEKQ